MHPRGIACIRTRPALSLLLVLPRLPPTRSYSNRYKAATGAGKSIMTKGSHSKIIDFRSDTVTVASEGMRKVMAEALVGDDVYNEDPTIHALESKLATMCGHEAALFCVSGTMTNQLAIRSHLISTPPYSVLLDARSHIYQWECGGVAYHSGASTTPVWPSNSNFHLTVKDIAKHFVEEDIHAAPTRVVALENSLDGEIMPLETVKEIRKYTETKNVPLHLDGARLWNVVAKTGISFETWCRQFDSVSICLSKGLGCPIGSVLIGKKDFIERARKFRKLFGGGWRQAGHLAAAGLYAIENHFPSVFETDHANATFLAKELLSLTSKTTNTPIFETIKRVDTNMIWLKIRDEHYRDGEGVTFEALLGGLGDRFKIAGYGNEARIVVHLGVSKQDCAELIAALKDVV